MSAQSLQATVQSLYAVQAMEQGIVGVPQEQALTIKRGDLLHFTRTLDRQAASLNVCLQSFHLHLVDISLVCYPHVSLFITIFL